MVSAHNVLVGANSNPLSLLHVLRSFTNGIPCTNDSWTSRLPGIGKPSKGLKRWNIWEVHQHGTVLPCMFHALPLHLQREILLLLIRLRLLWHVEEHYQARVAYAKTSVAVAWCLVLRCGENPCFTVRSYCKSKLLDIVPAPWPILCFLKFPRSKPKCQFKIVINPFKTGSNPGHTGPTLLRNPGPKRLFHGST